MLDKDALGILLEPIFEEMIVGTHLVTREIKFVQTDGKVLRGYDEAPEFVIQDILDEITHYVLDQSYSITELDLKKKEIVLTGLFKFNGHEQDKVVYTIHDK